MSAAPTHGKLSTETVSVRDKVIGEGSFGHVKVDHLNSLDLQYAAKEGKEKLHFQLVFEAGVLQELRDCKVFPFVFGVCVNRLAFELICSGIDYYNASTITNLKKKKKKS